MCVRFFSLAVLILFSAASSQAAEPVPPLMTSLMSIFPEERGWFVDGPLGLVASIPEDAQLFFDRPRVLAPDLDGLRTAVGKLFAASERLPLKKITRFDEKPGADGLPGLRGIWCETENEDDVGFLILTPNQNRFLIWAKYHYYPSLDAEDVPRKVRDLHARSISDYLASIDFNVPDNTIPRASDRNLPEWMDLYPATTTPAGGNDQKLRELMAIHAEIKIWGWSGLTAFIPSDATIDRFIDCAPDTLYANKERAVFQQEYRAFLEAGGTTDLVNVLTRTGFDTLTAGSYIFAVDRYGRVRIARNGDQGTQEREDLGWPRISHVLLFPGLDVLAAGVMEIRRNEGQPFIHAVSTHSTQYFYSRMAPTIRADVADHSERYLLSLGHLFRSLKVMRIPLSGVLIRKF